MGSPPKNLEKVLYREKNWLWLAAGLQVEPYDTLRNFFWHPTSDKKAVNAALKLVPEFVPTAERIIQMIRTLFKTDFSLVNASRTIPEPTDLIFISDSDIEDDVIGQQLEGFHLPNMGDSRFLPLAESLIAPLTTDHSSFDSNRYVRETSDLGERVNRALTERLFPERGYKIAADYRFLLSAEKFEQTSNRAFYPGDHPLLIQLHLTDSRDRKFSFQDVGSGLGYVLPVLVSIFGDNDVSIIQQPELHLHPALQASLGDVLLEACNDGKQLIIETHSEHLLLRILRRVRQTSSGSLPDERLRLTPEDISLLYFDPSPNGSTHVVPIRVSPDGDFLDRWPRGFFAERELELFDE